MTECECYCSTDELPLVVRCPRCLLRDKLWPILFAVAQETLLGMQMAGFSGAHVDKLEKIVAECKHPTKS